MGKFAENLNLDKRVLPPSEKWCENILCLYNEANFSKVAPPPHSFIKSRIWSFVSCFQVNKELVIIIHENFYRQKCVQYTIIVLIIAFL